MFETVYYTSKKQYTSAGQGNKEMTLEWRMTDVIQVHTEMVSICCSLKW